YKHDDDRDHHGGNHHRQMFGHADGGDDGVDGEHEVEDRDLHDHAEEGRASRVHLLVVAVDKVMYLARPLGEKEDAAGKEHQVAPRESLSIDRDDGFGEMNDEGDTRQQRDPHDERQRQADPPSLLAPFLGQPAGRNGKEDDVVDTQNDFENGKGEKACPDVEIGQQLEHFQTLSEPDWCQFREQINDGLSSRYRADPRAYENIAEEMRG